MEGLPYFVVIVQRSLLVGGGEGDDAEKVIIAGRAEAFAEQVEGCLGVVHVDRVGRYVAVSPHREF